MEKILEITIDGEPIAHCRPRFSRGRVYNTSATEIFKQKVGILIRSQYQSHVDEDSKFRIDMKFYRSNRQRIDLDNLSKSILDAITKIQIWKDDSQIQELHAEKILAHPKPRVEIILYRIVDNSPKPNCENCGKPMKRFSPCHKKNNRRFCSDGCYQKSVNITLKCIICGNDYTIPKSLADRRRRQVCSKFCSDLAIHKEIEKRPARYKCQDCGAPITRKEYKRCSICSIKNRYPNRKGAYFKNIKV